MMPALEHRLAQLAPTVDGDAAAAVFIRQRRRRHHNQWLGRCFAAAAVASVVIAGIVLVTDQSSNTVDDQTVLASPPEPPISASLSSASSDAAPAADPLPTTPCGSASFGGVRVDARNWINDDSDAVLTIAPSSNCVIEALEVQLTGNFTPRIISASSADVFPIAIRVGEAVNVRVSGTGDVCSPDSVVGDNGGWLGISFDDYRAESRSIYSTDPSCEYSFSVEVEETAESSDYPACDAASGLVNTGERDYAGTRNTTFVNRGDHPCSINSATVIGVTDNGQNIPFTDYGDGDVSGVPDNVLPVVLGPGRGIAVMLVSWPTCLLNSVGIVSTSIEVADQEIDIPIEPGDSCRGSYTVLLIEDSS